jgi:glycosyltransferase involved in cell wall biosynthesis
MSAELRVSLIISNYNYGYFLAEAVDSCLSQTYPHRETIVVDDGSTDESAAVIHRYGSRVRPIWKANGGQASAFNAGFAQCRGDIIVFVDADDMLLPHAVENAVAMFTAPDVVKVHWPLVEVNGHGERTGRVVPGYSLSEGDLLESVIRHGPSITGSPPTTGNAWRRAYLESVMPIPEAEYRLCADDYLCSLTPAFGRIAALRVPQALYRTHDRNGYVLKPFEEKTRVASDVQAQQCVALRRILATKGIHIDLQAWHEDLWYRRLDSAIGQILLTVPPGTTFILVDEDAWGAPNEIAGRRRLPFPEYNGAYGGPPGSDDQAIAELERLRADGAEFLVVAWTASWWLSHYRRFRTYVRMSYPEIHESDQLSIWSLIARKAP